MTLTVGGTLNKNKVFNCITINKKKIDKKLFYVLSDHLCFFLSHVAITYSANFRTGQNYS